MRTAIHHEALTALLGGAYPIPIYAAVVGSTVSVTIGVLSQYQATLGSNPHFQNWFSAIQQHKKLKVHLSNQSPPIVQAVDAITNEYATASYFAGGSIVAKNTISAALNAALKGIGTEISFIENPNFNTSNGDDPFLTLHLPAGGDLNFNILERFILAENEITVYDKFINNDSLELLNFIASKSAAGSTIRIFHSTKTGGNLLTSPAIQASLSAANPSISVHCKTCPTSFTRQYHDRFIFFGKRFQVRFSAGLDCFGPLDPITGNRVNRESDLIFRDTTASGQLAIVATDGSTHSVNFYSA